MDYRVCVADLPGTLEQEVSQAIREGWRPLGGVAVAFAFRKFFYHQAMVREVPTLRAQGPGPVVVPPIPPVRPTPPELGRAVGPRYRRRFEEG